MLARSEELDGNYTWDEITKDFNEETGKGVCTTTVFSLEEEELHSGQEKPKTAVKSKRHIDKVMGLCAVLWI